jgi:hypothetical protein
MGLLDRLKNYVPPRKMIKIAAEDGAAEGATHPDVNLYNMYQQMLLTEKDKVSRAYMEGYCVCYENTQITHVIE